MYRNKDNCGPDGGDIERSWGGSENGDHRGGEKRTQINETKDINKKTSNEVLFSASEWWVVTISRGTHCLDAGQGEDVSLVYGFFEVILNTSTCARYRITTQSHILAPDAPIELNVGSITSTPEQIYSTTEWDNMLHIRPILLILLVLPVELYC